MIKTSESTRKTERKTAKKASMTQHSRGLENLNPSFTKKGPGRYHVQGKGEEQ